MVWTSVRTSSELFRIDAILHRRCIALYSHKECQVNTACCGFKHLRVGFETEIGNEQLSGRPSWVWSRSTYVATCTVRVIGNVGFHMRNWLRKPEIVVDVTWKSQQSNSENVSIELFLFRKAFFICRRTIYAKRYKKKRNKYGVLLKINTFLKTRRKGSKMNE